MNNIRKVSKYFKSQGMMEGAGVLIHRSIGTNKLRNLDPFLMLDEFKNDNPEDYIEGFPDHPHRGFETVTYMLKGSFEHRDHMGNVGLLKDGSVQWMTAGAGIIHSEMPKQTEGMVHGFQMWINLPKKEKMCKPRYQDIQPEEIPTVEKDNIKIKVIAGEYEKTVGPVNGITTQPIFFDVRLPPNTSFQHHVPTGHTCFAYLFEGSASFGDLESNLDEGNIVVFDSQGDTVTVKSSENKNASFILVAAKPIGEPIFQRGPFVLASQEDLMQAFIDMQTGMFLKRAN